MRAIIKQLDNPAASKGQREILRAALKVGKAPAKYAAKFGIKLAGAILSFAIDLALVDELNANEFDYYALQLIDGEIERRNKEKEAAKN